MLRKFEPGDRTYVNWCGVPVTVVGYDGPRVLARSQRGSLTIAGVLAVSVVGRYEESELGPVGSANSRLGGTTA